MITIRAEAIMDKVLFYLDPLINEGMQTGSLVVAMNLWTAAREALVKQVTSSGGKLTGNLEASMSFRKMSTGISTYALSEMYVDTNKAPYAEWIELGKYAANIPYQNTEGRDYRNSKFSGHHYLQTAIRKVGKIAAPTVAETILKKLSNPAIAGDII